MPTQKIEPLNNAEKAWVATELSNARTLVAQDSGKDIQATITLEALDQSFKACCANIDPKNGKAINGIINTIGIAFGQYLVEHLGMEWAAVTDEYGCDLAVVGLQGKADVLVFPTNFVAKRWERREVDFLVISFQQIAKDYAEARAAWDKTC